MHNAPIPANNHTLYQALPSRQPHIAPPVGGGDYGDVDVKGQNYLARVREIAAIAAIQATTKQRIARGDEHNQIAAIPRSEHQAGDLVDNWYDPPNTDTPGWRSNSNNHT